MRKSLTSLSLDNARMLLGVHSKMTARRRTRIEPPLRLLVGRAAPCIPIILERGGSSGARWVWVPTFLPDFFAFA